MVTVSVSLLSHSLCLFLIQSVPLSLTLSLLLSFLLTVRQKEGLLLQLEKLLSLFVCMFVCILTGNPAWPTDQGTQAEE